MWDSDANQYDQISCIYVMIYILREEWVIENMYCLSFYWRVNVRHLFDIWHQLSWWKTETDYLFCWLIAFDCVSLYGLPIFNLRRSLVFLLYFFSLSLNCVYRVFNNFSLINISTSPENLLFLPRVCSTWHCRVLGTEKHE